MYEIVKSDLQNPHLPFPVVQSRVRNNTIKSPVHINCVQCHALGLNSQSPHFPEKNSSIDLVTKRMLKLPKYTKLLGCYPRTFFCKIQAFDKEESITTQRSKSVSNQPRVGWREWVLVICCTVKSNFFLSRNLLFVPKGTYNERVNEALL